MTSQPRFDFLEYQNHIGNCFTERDVYCVWNEICQRRDKFECTLHEWQELSDTVKARFLELQYVKTGEMPEVDGGGQQSD